MASRGKEVGKLVKRIKLQLCRMTKSRDLMYTMMIIVDNTISNTENLLRESISDALITYGKDNYRRR